MHICLIVSEAHWLGDNKRLWLRLSQFLISHYLDPISGGAIPSPPDRLADDDDDDDNDDGDDDDTVKRRCAQTYG